MWQCILVLDLCAFLILLSVSTRVGISIIARKVYRVCVVSVGSKGTVVDLFELDMVGFYVIFRMDWLHSCYAYLDCRTHMIVFKIP